MSGSLSAATLATAVAAGLVGGVFFAFSAFVMPALGALPAPRGLEAMQSINRAAVTPPLMIALFGGAIGCAILMVAALRAWHEPFAGRLLVGGVVYLVGVILVTMAYHVPRNDALARIAPDSSGAAAAWESYLSGWTAGNHVRAIAAVIAAAALADALRVA